MEHRAVREVEHPEPPVFLAHPQAGFVRLQGRPRQELGADQACLRGERIARRLQHVDEGDLAEVEPEQIGEQRRQTLESYPLREAQIDDERAQVLSERRTARHVGGRLRSALNFLAQQGQLPPNNVTRVTSGFMSGISIWSYTSQEIRGL